MLTHTLEFCQRAEHITATKKLRNHVQRSVRFAAESEHCRLARYYDSARTR